MVFVTAASLALTLASARMHPALAAGKPVATSTAAPFTPPSADTFCAAFVRRIPAINGAQCQAAGLMDSGARSVHGVPIMVRDVPPVADGLAAPSAITSTGKLEPPATPGAADASASSPRPVALPVPPDTAVPANEAAGQSLLPPRRVLILGAIHGDELTAATLAMVWLAAADHAQPEDTSRRIHWRFVPALNADGLLGPKPQRTNARGIDLNRNFPTPNWTTEAAKWWQTTARRDPRRFPGTQALSEPESRWVAEEMTRWEPDLIVSIHAPFGLLDFDGTIDPPRQIGRLTLDPVGVYPGSLGNYGGLHKGVPVLTIELPHALKPPSESEMKLMWRDMLTWIDRRWPAQVAAVPADAKPAR